MFMLHLQFSRIVLRYLAPAGSPTLEGENPSRYATLAAAKHVAHRYVDMAQERGGFELLVRKPYRPESTTSWRLVDEEGDRVHILIARED